MAHLSSKDHLLKPYARSLRRPSLDKMARITILKYAHKATAQFTKWLYLPRLNFIEISIYFFLISIEK
jgi:hypothetical protein